MGCVRFRKKNKLSFTLVLTLMNLSVIPLMLLHAPFTGSFGTNGFCCSRLSFTHELIREFQSSNPGVSNCAQNDKMASLTRIYDKQGVHSVLGRVPGPRRVIVQNADK